MRLQHLLVPTDFGPAADRALDLAIATAARWEGRVELVHAFQVPMSVYMFDAPMTPPPIDLVMKSAREAFDAAVARARSRDQRIEATWVEGDPRPRILDVAREHGADAIFMGTHGHGHLGRAFFGSVADRIVRTSPVPVLTTAEVAAQNAEQGVGFRHILLATDFGEPAARALTMGVELARRFDAKLTILHVYDLPTTTIEGRQYWVATEVVRAAEGALARAEAVAKRRHAQVATLLLRGDPRDRIVDTAASGGVDLVVMGTHQRRGLSRAFLGSVAERVVRTCAVPVLTTRADSNAVSDSNAP